MKVLRWGILIVIAGLINAVVFFAVPLASAMFIAPPKPEFKIASTSTQIDVATHEQQKETRPKEIRRIVQEAKTFKPARATSGPARGLQMDLSLATGGEGGQGGVGVSGGGGGGNGGIGGGDGLGAMVYDPNEVDQVAKVVKAVEPVFPVRARKEGVGGLVKLYLVIDQRGMPTDVQVLSVEPAGYGFETEAIKAMRQFKFEPAQLQGVPVAQKSTKEFDFPIGY